MKKKSKPVVSPKKGGKREIPPDDILIFAAWMISAFIVMLGLGILSDLVGLIINGG